VSDGVGEPAMHKSLRFLLFLLVLLSLSLLTVVHEAYASPGFETPAFIAYTNNAGTNLIKSPRTRIWAVWAWSPEVEVTPPDAGSNIRWIRVACCPNDTRYYEKIIVTLSDDGYLDTYVRRKTDWYTTTNIGFPGTTVNAYRAFDIAYEKTTGRALLVYSRGTTTLEIGYRIWDGSSWSSETTFELARTTEKVNWIALASAPGTRSGTGDDNEIAMIYIDNNVDVHGYVWTGSAWSEMGAAAVWDASAAIATKECIAVAYEQNSGEAMFIWADTTSTDFYYRTWDGTTLGGPTLLDIAAAGGIGSWLTFKPRPNSNGILLGVLDAGADISTRYWSGTAWDTATEHPEHEASADGIVSRCLDLEWEPDGTDALFLYGDGSSSNSLVWRKGTPTTGATWWTAATSLTSGTQDNGWVQLRRNPRTISGDTAFILGAVLDDDAALGRLIWNGATLTYSKGFFTADTSVTTYESFEIEFQLWIHQAPIVHVDPLTQSVSAAFTVKVNITFGYDIYAWQFNMTYDKTILTATNVVEGTFLSAGGSTQFNKTIDDTKGWVWAYASLLNDVSGVTGNGTLATVNFTPDQDGTSTLDLHDTKLVEYDFTSKKTLNYPPNLLKEIDGSVTVTVVVPEFPLGLAMELPLATVIVYIWLKRKHPKSSTTTFKQ